MWIKFDTLCLISIGGPNKYVSSGRGEIMGVDLGHSSINGSVLAKDILVDLEEWTIEWWEESSKETMVSLDFINMMYMI